MIFYKTDLPYMQVFFYTRYNRLLNIYSIFENKKYHQKLKKKSKHSFLVVFYFFENIKFSLLSNFFGGILIRMNKSTVNMD